MPGKELVLRPAVRAGCQPPPWPQEKTATPRPRS